MAALQQVAGDLQQMKFPVVSGPTALPRAWGSTPLRGPACAAYRGYRRPRTGSRGAMMAVPGM